MPHGIMEKIYKKIFRCRSERKAYKNIGKPSLEKAKVGTATRLTIRPLTKPVQFWTQISCAIEATFKQATKLVQGARSECEVGIRLFGD